LAVQQESIEEAMERFHVERRAIYYAIQHYWEDRPVFYKEENGGEGFEIKGE
jgi:hypothetical protein